MSDAAPAISNAAGFLFPNAVPLMCFFHVVQACKRKAKQMRLSNRQLGDIKAAIDLIHHSADQKEYLRFERERLQ